MKKNMGKITCFFVLVLLSGLVIANPSVKSEEHQGEKAMPGVMSLLLDDVVAPPFPDTGQNECYNNDAAIPCPSDPTDDFYGQDAQYPRSSRSYTKLGQDGEELADDTAHSDNGGEWIITRDNVTGLIWEIKTNANKDDTYTWQDANDVFIAGINDDQFGGFTDWRLPSRAELSSLSDRGQWDPAIRYDPTATGKEEPHYDRSRSNTSHAFWFPNTSALRYWSSNPLANNSGNIWRVNFIIGFTYYEQASEEYYVRAVRGPVFDYTDLKDNGPTVTDNGTGLMWKKCSYGQEWDQASESCTGGPTRLTWKDALAAAAAESGWRLPNISELQSLVDDSIYDPAIYEPFGNHLPQLLNGTLPYWSSTTDVQNQDRAWLINFVDGSNNYDGYAGQQGLKTREFYIRLVRTLN